LRSFSYAAFSAADRALNKLPEDGRSPAAYALSGWARAWQDAASAQFLDAYRETIAVNPALLPQAEEAQALLDAYVLEKALYELLYELNNRPTWLRIPISGILSLR